MKGSNHTDQRDEHHHNVLLVKSHGAMRSDLICESKV